MEIPIYRRRNTIPAKTGGVMISPEKVAEPYRAEAKIGETISNIGFKAAELNNQYMAAEKRAERTLEAQKLENALKNDFADAQLTIDQTGDYKQFETITNSKIAELKKKHIDSIQDPIVRRAGELVFSTLSGNLIRYAKIQKVKSITEESTNLWEVDYGRSVDAYARETDPTRKAVIKDTLRIKGLELEDARMMKQGATERAMFKFEQDTAKLEEAYKKDAESALKQKEVEAKEAIKLSREATGNEFVSRLVSGKLTRADVLKSNLEPTGENGKQYWMEQIQKKEDKAAKKSAVTVKTDPLFEKDIALSIFRAENASNKEEVLKNIKRAIVEGLISDKLNPDDANKYNKKIDELLNPKGQGGLTLTEKTQKDIMVERFNDAYKNGLFGEFGSDDGAREFLKQINAYEQWKESSESKGKDDIEYWEKIMKPYNEGFIKSLISGKNAFQALFGDDIDPVRRRKEGELLATEKRVSNTYVESGNYDIKLTSEEVAMTKKQLIQRLQLKYNVPYSEAVNMVDEIRSGNIPVGLEKTEKKVVGYSNGKPVYDLGNGQWQIGD